MISFGACTSSGDSDWIGDLSVSHRRAWRGLGSQPWAENLGRPWGTDQYTETLLWPPTSRSARETITLGDLSTVSQDTTLSTFVPWLPGRTHLSPNRWREWKPGCLKIQNEERCSPGQQGDWVWSNGPGLIARAFLTEAAVTPVLPVD